MAAAEMVWCDAYIVESDTAKTFNVGYKLEGFYFYRLDTGALARVAGTTVTANPHSTTLATVDIAASSNNIVVNVTPGGASARQYIVTMEIHCAQPI